MLNSPNTHRNFTFASVPKKIGRERATGGWKRWGSPAQAYMKREGSDIPTRMATGSDRLDTFGKGNNFHWQ